MTIHYLSKIQNLTSLFYLINVFDKKILLLKKLNLLIVKFLFWDIIDYLKNDVNFENSQLSIFEIIISKLNEYFKYNN